MDSLLLLVVTMACLLLMYLASHKDLLFHPEFRSAFIQSFVQTFAGGMFVMALL